MDEQAAARRKVAMVVFAILVVAIAVTVALTGSHENGKQKQAEYYCKKEPGMTDLTGPEFKNCVTQYLRLR